MSKQSVAVIMSTYNGSQHICEQIDSVLNQDIDNCSLFVRDDGSSDLTVAILRGYEKKGLLTLYAGKNMGVVGSFIDILDRVPNSFDFIALCDQDDVWHKDKLSRALRVLESRNNKIPQLYCSEYYFCDKQMNRVGRSHLNKIGVDFPKMLYENMVSGNTVVINRKLADAIISAGRDDIYCHDWWIALVASAIGDLTYDDYASLEYRRTGSNVSPTGSNRIKLLKYRIDTFFKGKQLQLITKQLEKLKVCFGEQMTEDKVKLLDSVLRDGNLRKAMLPTRLRQKIPEELALRLLFLTGRL